MTRIDYVKAPAGAGKTYSATSYMKPRVARGEKFILVQPITRLIGETVETTFARLGIDPNAVTEISERTRPDGGIVQAVVEHINDAVEGRGEVLVITHAAFLRLIEVYESFRDRWTVIIDETLEVQEPHALNLPDSHDLVTRHLEVADASDPVYWEIRKARGSTKLDDIARNRSRDDLYDRLQKFAAAVVSNHRTVLVRADSYAALVAGTDQPGIRRQLNAFTVLHPSALKGWQRVVVMAANFTDTPMYLCWSRMRDGAAVFNDITAEFAVRDTEHRNGHLLDIWYGYEGRWSKAFADKVVPDDPTGRTHLDAFVDAVRDHVGAEPVAVLANNDAGSVERRLANGVRLPAYAHGLNAFQDLDAAVLLLAANPTPAHVAALKHVAGLTDGEIATGVHRQSVYQGATRISLRDPESTSRKTLYFPDRPTAEYHHGLFPGSRLHRLDLGLPQRQDRAVKVGRPKFHASGADRQRAYRERKEYEDAVRLERELRLRLVNGHPIADRHVIQADALAGGMTETFNVADATADRAEFQGTFFLANLHENVGHAVPYASFEDLVAVFRDLSRERHAAKDECYLWSPAHYVPKTRNFNPDGIRCGYVNMAIARHIILDNDGGDLTPERFAALFPGLRMMIYSTWSSTAAQPKWRAVIETDHLLDIDGYKLVTGRLVSLLNDRGYYGTADIQSDPALASRKSFMGAHGFDASKLNPVARLYVPSLGAHPADAFFADFAGGQRRALPVFAWVEACPVPARPPVPSRRSSNVLAAPNPKADPRLQRLQATLLARNAARSARRKEFQIEAALDWWAIQGDQNGQRDRNYCHLAGRLYRAGCDRCEFDAHLLDAANAARRSKADLRAKIPRLWKSVSRWDR